MLVQQIFYLSLPFRFETTTMMLMALTTCR